MIDSAARHAKTKLMCGAQRVWQVPMRTSREQIPRHDSRPGRNVHQSLPEPSRSSSVRTQAFCFSSGARRNLAACASRALKLSPKTYSQRWVLVRLVQHRFQSIASPRKSYSSKPSSNELSMANCNSKLDGDNGEYAGS